MRGLIVELSVRGIEDSDLERRVAWLNDPVVSNGLAITPPITLAHTRQWLSRTFGDGRRLDVVFQDRGGEVVAMGGLSGIDYVNRNCELYVFVDPAQRGRGIGLSATAWLCEHAFEAKRLERVFLWMYRDNVVASAMYQKIGFRLEGTLRSHRLRGGELVDRQVMGLLREEWTANGRSVASNNAG